MTTTLKQDQQAMAAFLRQPGNYPPPAGVEERRLKIYQDLIYKNIEGFICGGFPVLRSLYEDSDWHEMVRSFINVHRCHTPYFLEISQEFISYLVERHEMRACDPPFLQELAHYEWVELALDVSTEVLAPQQAAPEELVQCCVNLSPLAWSLQYAFPVHRIGRSFRPEQPAEPTCIVVYRNWDNEVKFLEINAPTARLLQLIEAGQGASLHSVLGQLAAEMGMEEAAVLEFGVAQVAQLVDKSVVLVTGGGVLP